MGWRGETDFWGLSFRPALMLISVTPWQGSLSRRGPDATRGTPSMDLIHGLGRLYFPKEGIRTVWAWVEGI